LAEAKNVLDVRYPRWTTQWVINDERQIQDWINEWMFNVMGYWRVTGAGQLQLAVEPGLPQVHFTSADVVESIVASRDCVDGDDGVVFTMDRHHLVNKLEAFYLWSWGEGKAVNRLIGPTAEDAISINAYGEIRKAVTLRGNRYQPYVEEWANILFSRQAFDSRVEGATVEFTVKGSKLAHATISDLLAFSWPYGPTRENGNIYVNQIIRIVSITHDYARGGSSRVTALDTGDYVTLGGVRLLNPLEL
jgi:hypothetical protein